MKKLLLLLIVLFVSGCANIVAVKNESDLTALRHENSEVELLTEAEFMSRVSRSATLIYEGMVAISDAAKLYALENNGKLPPGGRKAVRSLLLDGGYLKTWPTIPPFAFTDPVEYEFRYKNGFADLDGLGEADDLIYAQDLKIEVCEDFLHRYSSAGSGDVIYDYEANGGKYPGEVFGRHVKIYAITWSDLNISEYCDIEWVMQYNVPPPSKPGRK